LIYDLIYELSDQYATKVLCKILAVSRSAYYDYLSGNSWRSSPQRALLESDLKTAFVLHKRRYGSRRLTDELKDMGHTVGRHQVRSMMKSLSLQAIQPRSFVPKTTQVDDFRWRNPNLLLDIELPPTGPNQILVGDITYLPCEEGWLFLATWMDLFSRMVPGHWVSDRLTAELVIIPMKHLISRRDPPPGAIVHSDGGGQYKSAEFRQLLKRNGFRQSMTRKDNHYDNAYGESLFSRIKAELLSEYPVFRNLQHARTEVFEYIEGYYNLKRRHSSLGNISPVEFEEKHKRR
jgi:transposase InsO family protein